MIQRLILLFSIILIISANQVIAQIDSSRSYGAYFNLNFNNHSASFRDFNGISTCCPIFESGSGSGISFGAIMDFPLPANFRIGLKAEYSSIGATLIKDESLELTDGINILEGIFQHKLKSSISTFGAAPFVSYKTPIGINLNMGAFAGMILQKTFNYDEVIIQPQDRGVFVENGLRNRNQQSGDIPEAASVYGALFFGAGYEIPINKQKNLTLSPEIAVTVGLTEFVRSKEWSANSLKLGLALRYYTPQEVRVIHEKRIKNYVIDTTKIIVDNPPAIRFKTGLESPEIQKVDTGDTLYVFEKIKRTDTLFFRSAPKAEISTDTKAITIRKRYVTEAFPILPMIFFEKDSDKIPEIYTSIKSPDEFDFESVNVNPIEFHNNVLNIIAQRLKQFPKAKLQITGFADSSSESSSCNLAINRANAIKDYLGNIWKIEDKRLIVNQITRKCSPQNATLTANDSGYSENRRVELSSDLPSITEPIKKENFLETEYLNPESIKLKFAVASPEIKEWNLIVKFNNQELIRLSGEKFSQVNIPIDKELIPKLDNGMLQFDYYIEDIEGRTAMNSISIPIKVDTNEFSVERLSLVLFDVGSSDLSDLSVLALKKFIKGLDKFSTVRITGFTDALGIQENNLELSINRARNTADLIKQIQPETNILSVDGVAANKRPYGIDSYATPPERFLSRTVQIENLIKIK